MSEDPYSQEVTRAGWLIDVGQYERAMQILAHLLAGYPDNACFTYKVMALAHNSVDRFGDAEAAARKALAVQPNDPDAHRLLAEALIAQDRDPEAEPSLRTALQLAPEDDALLSLMSIALIRMGHTQEALFYAREAARLSPGSADNHMILAVAQMETDPQAAETALQETLALDPMFDDALLLRSWMLDERGNHHDAAKALAAYTTQTSDHERSRLMVDAFLMKLTSSALEGLWGATILTLLFLPLVRTMNLPGSLCFCRWPWRRSPPIGRPAHAFGRFGAHSPTAAGEYCVPSSGPVGSAACGPPQSSFSGWGSSSAPSVRYGGPTPFSSALSEPTWVTWRSAGSFSESSPSSEAGTPDGVRPPLRRPARSRGRP